MGKGFIKKGQRREQKVEPYAVKVCSTRYKDPQTGQWASPPADAPKMGRAKLRTGRTGAVVLSRRVVEHDDGHREVVGARVVHGEMRRAQRRGKVSKAAVREVERDLGRELLMSANPARAGEVEREMMHEAHRSSKAKRGAVTRKKNAARKKPADVVSIKTKVLKAEQLVKDAERRHERARTASARSKAHESLRSRRTRLSKLRQELKRAGG